MYSAYLHIPFCLSKCHYCDFYSLGWGEKSLPEEEYVQALSQEMSRWTGCVKMERANPWKSVFFGGGTPSLLSAQALDKILKALEILLPWDASTELSLEMNPKTADPKKLKDYRSIGVNRVSLGVQSLEEPLLENLGRAHNGKDALQSLEWIMAAPFSNF
ncbi:MAG: radical SAM protein, partial [bacterium]|nr:radical SAM protein [bacterium]